jgi:DNA-binding transcriptional ArsR family regulator
MSTTRIARQPAAPLTPEERAKIFKALSDERRIDIVDSLAKHGSQCGTQLAEELGISIALVCHHWEVLVEAGLVKKERVGQLRMCTLDAERLAQATGAWSGKRAPKPPPKNAAARVASKVAKKRSASSKTVATRKAPRATKAAKR